MRRSFLSPAYAGLAATGRELPRARGLALGYTLPPASTRAPAVASLPTQGSRTRPGLHAAAREYAGSCGCVVAYPRLADSPWATRCRPLTRARGLSCYLARTTQGSRTRPGLHAVARLRGLAGLAATWRELPRARGLALGYTLSPAYAGSRA
jgi:hypothetical protein